MSWPRSLFGRNVLLFVTLLVASQLAWLTLFRVMVQTPRLERLANYVLEHETLCEDDSLRTTTSSAQPPIPSSTAHS